MINENSKKYSLNPLNNNNNSSMRQCSYNEIIEEAKVLLINLNVISQIQNNDKIKRNGKYLSIDRDHYYLQTFKRKWNGDGRDATTDSINKIIKSIRKIYFIAMNSRDKHKIQLHYFLKRILEELPGAINGITNLNQSSYYSDSTIRSILHNQNQLLTDFQSTISRQLNQNTKQININQQEEEYIGGNISKSY